MRKATVSLSSKIQLWGAKLMSNTCSVPFRREICQVRRHPTTVGTGSSSSSEETLHGELGRRDFHYRSQIRPSAESSVWSNIEGSCTLPSAGRLAGGLAVQADDKHLLTQLSIHTLSLLWQLPSQPLLGAM